MPQGAIVHLEEFQWEFVLNLHFYVRDTSVFRKKLDSIHIKREKLLAKMNMEALYSSIPHDVENQAVEYYFKSRGIQFKQYNEFALSITQLLSL